MKNIYLLTDYKYQFGAYDNATPYRSGYNLERLTNSFKEYGYMLEILNFAKVQLSSIQWENQIVIYTSNEEPLLKYKSYIEDVIYYLYLKNAILIPHYELIRANNNKVFMELYKRIILDNQDMLQSFVFGCLEDVLGLRELISFPVVFKPSEGAMSKGVKLISSWNELIKTIKKQRKSTKLKHIIKDELRAIIHKGYIKNSKYQGKFILQPFIKGLKNDWKVLIFGDQVYVLNRAIK